tara:strand:- start:95 stop:475 length:381 start_codon:yes stop_codon:yes gene_type:complete
MAYANVITVNEIGGGRWLVQINETDAGVATEAVITGLPVDLRLLKQVTSLVSGTGTTVDPILGTAPAPSGVSIVAENDTAAADVNNVASPAIPFYAATGALYHRSICDAGADNVVVSLYFFLEHWA